MTEVGVIHSVKNVVDDNHTNIGILRECSAEASALNTKANVDIKTQINALASKSQLSAVSALVTGALKVVKTSFTMFF